MQLSPSDLALVKSQPQEFNLYLNIYQPESLFAAQVVGNISQGTRDIPYGNVTIGTPAAIKDNFIMMVGSQPGYNDEGTIRVRFVSGTYIVVAENSHIQWSSGQYITVLNYIDIDAVYPRIIQNPSNPEDVIFLKDYDIIYTNQNSIWGTFINMGPHRATFRDPATGLAQLYWSASGTYNVKGDTVSYDWEFEGATVTGSSLATPGYITYDHAGDFRTRLTVSGTSGEVDTSYRWVSVKDRPDAGPNRPLLKWEISNLHGGRSEAGFTGRIKIREPVDNINYLKDGALIVIFSDDYYAGTRKNLGGNAENCSEIFFVGYILKGSISYNYKEGSVEFDIGSVTEMMKISQGFSVSCQDDLAPNTWYKLQGLTVPKAIYHYLRWHSTVLFTTDFQYLEDDRPVQYFDSNRESLYDAVAKFVESGIKGEMVCDRQGKIWAELSAAAKSNARTAYPSALSISKNDWTSNPPSSAGAVAARAGGVSSSPSLTERVFPEQSYLEYGGIFYPGSGTASQAMLASAPGTTPSYKGGINQVEGFILTSQSQLNQLVGNVFGYMNSRFPEVFFSLAGAYKNLDIAPIEMEQLNMDAADTPRGIVFINEPFHITSTEWNYDPITKSIIQTPHFAQLVNGIAGETIPVPPAPPADGGFKVPGVKVPPITFSGFGIPTGTAGVFAAYRFHGQTFNGSFTPLPELVESKGISVVGSLASGTSSDGLIDFTFGVGGLFEVLVSEHNPQAFSHTYPFDVGISIDDSIYEYAHVGAKSTAAGAPSGDTSDGVTWSGTIRMNPNQVLHVHMFYFSQFDGGGPALGIGYGVSDIFIWKISD